MHGVFSSSGLKLWSPALLGSALYQSLDPTDVNGVTAQIWPSRALSAQDMIQSNPANAPGASVLLNRPVVQFASGNWFQAAIARDWTFLHDGTGCTYLAFVRPTNNGNSGVIIDTGPWGVSDRGLGIWYDGTNQQFNLFLSNGTSLIINANTGVGSYPRNVGHILCFQYDEAASPKYSLFIDNAVTPVLSGSPTGAPSGGDPVGPLFVGAHTAGHATYLTGYLGVQAFLTRSITSVERGTALAALKQEYGL